ncbi:MAG: hypothetical protein ACI9YE_003635 [Psychroserpens sp.]|jgi:hypothetical protein
MNFSSKILEEAVDQVSQLPGIGKRTALRLVLHLMRQPEQNTDALSQALLRMRHDLNFCKQCHNVSDVEICEICASHSRDQANWNEGGNDAGNRVYINSGFNVDDLQLGYWHLGEVLVSPGQQVSQGQLIGYTGNTGNVCSRFSAGPHLHIRARKNGIKTDPEEFFNADFGSQGQNINTCN